MRGAWIIVVLAACGRIGFSARDIDGDIDGTDGTTDVAMDEFVTVGNRSDAMIQNAILDVHLDTSTPTLNTGTHRDLHLVPDGQAPLLLHFDLSTLRAGTIVEAKLHMWIVGAPFKATSSVFLFRVNEAWDEGTGDYDVGAPNITERKPGTAWTNQGASSPTSRDPAGTQVGVGPTGLDEMITLTIAPVVADGWRDAANTGIALLSQDAMGSYAEWGSSEWPDETKRPLLVIHFAP